MSMAMAEPTRTHDRSDPPRKAYTVDDTPEIRAKIDADLQDIIDTVRCGDPGLRALVLTGGFARGEGAVLDGRPQNDYDLVAVRNIRPAPDYAAMRQELEKRLGLHIDLAPVATARLRWSAPSIFWYETATRGRVIWGEDVLPRIRVRDPAAIDAREGPRLLVNRAAGLLLERDGSDHDRRIQASKALLAALDARLLARGSFAPSHVERWQQYLEMPRPPRLAEIHDWLEWAIRFKTDPGRARNRDADETWRVAAKAVLTALPVSLGHAGYDDMESYAMDDGILDHLHFLRTSGRFVRHPTGRVRLATISMLEAALQGRTADQAMWLKPIARGDLSLEAVRGATLQ